MRTKQEIVENWLPRYTERKLEDFTKHILLTNFTKYVEIFADHFNVPILGLKSSMPNASAEGITIINFGMGSANAATIMDLLSAVMPKAVLFLGKCGLYVLANRDIELSCDAWVIRMMGEKNRSSYALMLIKMEEKRSGMSALYSHFGKNAISERIEAIMKFKKTSILACTLALALIAGATTAFAATNSDATADTSKEKLFGQLSATDDNVKSDGTVAVQKVDQSPFAEVDQESNNSGNDATAEQDGIANFPTQGTKTSIAAKSSIYYNFGTGANNTFYEADTVIEFSIQCVYADIPVQVSLVTADKTEVISSQVVESNEVTPISFTIPEDGDYLICITNESASRTQEYSHMIAR